MPRSLTDFLDVLVDPKDANIDLVAVHGLNPTNKRSGAKETWTSLYNKRLWLSHDEYLPQKLPRARVLLFGYDSNAAFHASIDGVREQARNLLHRLELERKENVKHRPIIFICHSLGGIVVKYALGETRLNEAYDSIRLSTYGIAFFATPHQGGYHAKLGDIVARVAARVLQTQDYAFMEALKKDSLFAPCVFEDFRHQLEDFFVLSFFENLPNKKSVTVDKKSATLGLSGKREIKIEMTSNHSWICKFEAPELSEYKEVIGNLQHLVSGAIKATEERERLKDLSIPVASVSLIKPFICPYPKNALFVGRELILEQVHQKLRVGEFVQTTQKKPNRSRSHDGISDAPSGRVLHNPKAEISERVVQIKLQCKRSTSEQTIHLHQPGNPSETGANRDDQQGSPVEPGKPLRHRLLYEENSATGFDDQQVDGQHEKSGQIPQNERVVSLLGPAGVGKSQIALAYIYWLRQQKTEISIFWIDGSSVDRFRQGYLQIAQRCRIPTANKFTVDILPLVDSWLEDEKNGQWLMVIDNAYETETIRNTGKAQYPKLRNSCPLNLEHYIPMCDHGSILVITRNKEAAFKFTRRGLVNVTENNEIESTSIISGIVTSKEHGSDHAKSLASLLDFQPVALVQAAAYIEQKSLSTEEYIDTYHAKAHSVSQFLRWSFEGDGQDFDIPNTVATSWIASFDSIRETDPRAAEILLLIACFDCRAIPECLLKDPNESSISFKKSIDKLLDFSLITRNVGNKHLDEHRLGHLTTRAWLRQSGKEDQWALTAQELLLGRLPTPYYPNWDICAAYLPHVRVVIDRALKKTSRLYNQNIYFLMNWVVSYLGVQGSYLSSMEIRQERLKYCLGHLGPKHYNTLCSIKDLAETICHKGKHKKAERLLRQALVGFENAPGPRHSNTLDCVHILAITLNRQNKYEAAELLLRRAVTGRKKALGPKHPDTLNSIIELASNLFGQGQYTAAERLCRKAVADAKKTLGPNNPKTLDCINCLSVILYKMQRHEAADFLLRQVIAGRKKVLGPDHLQTLFGIDTLATGLCRREQQGAAVPLFRQVVAGFKKVLGPDHGHTLLCVDKLAKSLQDQGQHEEAERLFRQLTTSWRKEVGPEHPKTLRTVNNLAKALRGLGKHAEAEQLFRQVAMRQRKTLGPEHLTTIRSIEEVAVSLQQQELPREAEPFFRETLTGLEEALGPEHLDTLYCMSNLAIVLRKQGRQDEEAARLFWEALAGFEKVLGPGHQDTLRRLFEFALTIQVQGGQYEEAERLYRRALAGFQQALGPYHNDTLRCTYNLAFTLQKQGQREYSERLFRKALESCEITGGSEYRNMLRRMHNLAITLLKEEKYEEAEGLLQQVLAGFYKELGTGHLESINCLANLAVTLLKQERYMHAEIPLRQARSGLSTLLGPEHLKTINCGYDLAFAMYNQGQREEAEWHFQQALAGYKKTLGPEHPDTLRNIFKLADLVFKQGNFRRAERLFRQTLAGYEKTLGPEHPDTLTTISKLGCVSYERVQNRKAERLFRQALAGREKILGPENADTLCSIANLAVNLHGQGQNEEAEPLFHQALAGLEKVVGPTNLLTLKSMNDLIDFLTYQRKEEEAQVLRETLDSRNPEQIRFAGGIFFM